jgi:hypothetical protein
MEVMDVVTVITAKGEIKMTELIAETATEPKAASIVKPKANKKARVAPLGAHVAPKKGKSPKKASPTKKAPKGAKKAAGARDGSKTAKVLDLLKRPGGVTAKDLCHRQRPHESDWLAAAFRARLPVGYGRQEDGADRHIDQS